MLNFSGDFGLHAIIKGMASSSEKPGLNIIVKEYDKIKQIVRRG